MLKKTDMCRSFFDMIIEKEVIIKKHSYENYHGKICLLKMKKVSKPFYVSNEEHKVKIVDEGYSWLEIAFEKAYFFITAMFNEKSELIEIYIDMTNGNYTDCDNPFFEDMFLDFVVYQGKVIKLDEEELLFAYENKNISKNEYLNILKNGNLMYNYIVENIEDFSQRIISLYNNMK